MSGHSTFDALPNEEREKLLSLAYYLIERKYMEGELFDVAEQLYKRQSKEMGAKAPKV